MNEIIGIVAVCLTPPDSNWNGSTYLCSSCYGTYISICRVANSQLGQPEAMKLFCKDLLRNKSIVELRWAAITTQSKN